ncbi:Os06g0293750 [Oryza sativa Japonica Group]|uniref:Os06g0293750 protein n=1 Tax=Oryza sativa subsp. japonica TaxID=39947 RepID=A0A0P0WVE9_ORYSJ|nr:Os06g0293750 [Oryza sativa Japonica Group]
MGAGGGWQRRGDGQTEAAAGAAHGGGRYGRPRRRGDGQAEATAAFLPSAQRAKNAASMALWTSCASSLAWPDQALVCSSTCAGGTSARSSRSAACTAVSSAARCSTTSMMLPSLERALHVAAVPIALHRRLAVAGGQLCPSS